MTEREWDKRLHIRTIGREDESDANCSPYEPTPYPVLERLAESGHVRRKDRLMDFGCGKGRVAVFMASVISCRVRGVDYSRKLIDIAEENRRASRTGDRVTFECRRAERCGIRDENAFFFFNPFSERIFEDVLRLIVKSWRDDPRKKAVICYYPSEAYLQILDEAPELEKLDDIDCGDLFGGKNARERIVVYGVRE